MHWENKLSIESGRQKMSFIKALEYPRNVVGDNPSIKRFVESGGKLTNMKKTLLYSDAAFRAYLEWYPLETELKAFLSEKEIELFALSISAQGDCLLCSTYFRKALLDRGENPDHLSLSPREQLLSDFGRAIAKNSGTIPETIYRLLKSTFSDREIVLLTAFAGIMIATNVFNNALKVDLDDHLINIRGR